MTNHVTFKMIFICFPYIILICCWNVVDWLFQSSINIPFFGLAKTHLISFFTFTSKSSGGLEIYLLLIIWWDFESYVVSHIVLFASKFEFTDCELGKQCLLYTSAFSGMTEFLFSDLIRSFI